MNTARPLSDECSWFARSIEPYIDGELDPGHALDVETHVLRCVSCSERVAFARAARLSLKRTAPARCPDALRARICGTLVKEQAFEQAVRIQREANRETGPKLIGLRYALPLAAAAGVVFAMGLARVKNDTRFAKDVAPPSPSPAPASVSNAGFDTLIEDLVALHAHPLPPETTNPEELPRFESLVGVPVRRPQMALFEANFKGARVHAMRERRAALLQYTVKGSHRVTVYVFDPRAVPVRGTSFSRQVVRDDLPMPVYVGRFGGYSVAAAEERGIGYALATDLDDDESTKLMVAAVQR